MGRFFSNGRRPLLIPGSSQRQIALPDPRGIIVPEPSAAPMDAFEVDYDDLDVIRTWRTYEERYPDQVRYFCYELRHADPGAPVKQYFKAVRLIRLTRVPRYLRNSGQAGGGEVFGAMRDVLVGLREKQVLFLNLIAKSPTLPLVFAYGVQATGDTIEEACVKADDAYAALSVALDGTYQQLEYQPLSVDEGETLVRYQAAWNQIAMARGRPMPQGISLGSSAILDGNRTDAENTNNQLEAFIRGMADRSFMLSMLTTPLTPADMTAGWRNLTKELSKIRSDQQGSRGVNAGIALPLATGVSFGDGTGTTHGLTGTHGVGSNDGVSSSQSLGSSYTHTDGTSASLTNTNGTSVGQSDSVSSSISTAQGQSMSATDSISNTDTASASDSTNMGTSAGVGLSEGVNSSQGQSYSESQSATNTQSASASQGQSVGESVSVGQSSSLSQGASVSQSNSVNQSLGQTVGNTASSNWSAGMSNSVNASNSLTQGLNQAWSEALAHNQSLGWGSNQSETTGVGSSNQNSLNASLFNFGANMGEGSSTQNSLGQGHNNSGGVGSSNTATSSNGWSNSLGQTLGQSLGSNESMGGSVANSNSATSSVGQSQAVTAGQSITSSQGQSVTQSANVGQSVSQTLGTSASTGTGQSAGLSATQGTSQALSQNTGMSQGSGHSTGLSQAMGTGSSLAQGQSLTQSATDGRTAGTSASQSTAQAVGQGVSASDARGVSATNTSGASAGSSQQQSLSDAYMVAASRNAATNGSLGVAPSVGVSINKATFNESKRITGDVLEAQVNRYLDGIEGGGMLYQMFLVCPDRETLLGASSLLKASFWGSGGEKRRLTSPFHTEVIEDPEEASRLLVHASAFSSYRRREAQMRLIEPYMYSTFVTTGEASVFCHPPTHEALGLMANTDSMPVLSMPADRANRDVFLGHIVDGERGRVSPQRFGVDLSELTHLLVQGTTGSGKTTMMLRFLCEAATMTKRVTVRPSLDSMELEERDVPAGILALDWMENFRNLANVVPEDRFQLFSVSNPELGAFRFNPLEIPHPSMDPAQWLGAQSDQLAASFGLGEFGRSLISEVIDELYRANRLEEYELRPAILGADGQGVIEAPAVMLAAVDEALVPESAIVTNPYGERVANVYSFPELSRLVGLPDVATVIARKIGEGATQEAGRLQGTDIRNRLQSLWRRLQYYAPGNPGYQMVASDPSLEVRECMGVTDLIDPERGLVTVIETDGLDTENRRVVLGSVMLAVYRYGLHGGKGCFDQGGKGPGTFIVLEEAHELFGDATDGEDATSARMRANLYESLFRRARATGLRLVAMTQNCGHVPSAITSMTTTVIAHRTYDDEDRKRLASLFGWERTALGGHLREFRYLTELPRGYAIVRLDARDNYLESAPTQILVDPPALPEVEDRQLAVLARRRAARGR